MRWVEDNPTYLYSLRQAIALDGLVIESIESSESAQISRAVGLAAADLYEEWRVKDEADQRDLDFTDLLAEIAIALKPVDSNGDGV